LLQDNAYRKSFLDAIGSVGPGIDYSACVETALDELATGLEAALDIDRLFDAAR
jgi:cobyric acid synthase